jgi:hypothetical protein
MTTSVLVVGKDHRLAIHKHRGSGGLEQITNVMNMTLPVLANAVIGLQTVAPGSQIANLNATTGAVPSSVANALINIAGTNGKPAVVCDVLGVAAGYKITDNFNTTVSTLANTNVTYLTTIYQTMNSVVGGQCGNTVLGPVTIPSGQPAAGVYYANIGNVGNVSNVVIFTAADNAFTGGAGDDNTGNILPATGPGLFAVAYPEIGNIVAGSPAQVAVLNSAFTSIAAQISQENRLQQAADIDFANLLPNNQPTVFSLINSLPQYGQEIEPGGMSQFWTGVANISTFTGQAIVASLQEGLNQAALTEAGIRTNSTIPSTPGQT